MPACGAPARRASTELELELRTGCRASWRAATRRAPGGSASSSARTRGGELDELTAAVGGVGPAHDQFAATSSLMLSVRTAPAHATRAPARQAVVTPVRLISPSSSIWLTGQPVVRTVPAHLAGHRHHRFPQLGGRRPRSVVTMLHNQVIPWQRWPVMWITVVLPPQFSKSILVLMAVRQVLKWVLLAAVTAAVTYPLTLVGVPSAAQSPRARLPRAMRSRRLAGT